MAPPCSVPLSINSINPCVRRAEYAVRGALAIRAEEIRRDLAAGKDLEFDKVINSNIGNPQALDQEPLTFFRQVIALTEYPALLSDSHLPVTRKLFPSDAISRARTLLKEIGSTGSYTASQGIPSIRQHVAEYISKRDGHPSCSDDIFLTTGASGGVQMILQLLISSPTDGILIPIPQYPLYSAALSLLNGHAVPYNLEESSNWSTSLHSIEVAIEKARSEGIVVKGLVVINPGNPTGSVLPEPQISDLVKLCESEKLLIMADEVLRDEARNVQLVSFHTISKGMIGECGKRGGYMELCNIPSDVREQIYKLASIGLCPPVSGQIVVDVMVNPPKKGDESFEVYEKEYLSIYEKLKERAKMLQDAFKQMEGVECQVAQGAMYLFPRISFPLRFIETAKKLNKPPDEAYCMQLLNSTGICIVPGSGFGQKEGTYHVRTTFLAPGKELIDRWTTFHKNFMKEYKD